MANPHLWTLSFVLLAAGPSVAKEYLNESRTIAGPPKYAIERFTFTRDNDDLPLHLDWTIKLTQGRANLRILDPAGREVTSMGAGDCTILNSPVPGAREPGPYKVELITVNALGQWRLRIYDAPGSGAPPIGPGLASAGSMLLVALASVWFWRRHTGIQWRWFWVGAAVWTVAVAVKFAIGYATYGPVTVGLKDSVPYWAYLTIGTIYGGAMTGVTEVLFTFLAALIWRQMAASSSRGVAVGVGAGAFEAALLAIGVAIGAVVAALGISDAAAGPGSWLIALAPGVERVIAILCHTASRALALLAVASRRWALFWYGFLLMSAVDGVATIIYLTGQVNTISPWKMEALLAPFGLVSIPITIWCIRRWPTIPIAAEPAGLPAQASAIDGDSAEARGREVL